MIDDFLRAVAAYGGVARRVPTSGAARTAVGELLHESGARTICQWSGDVLVAALDLASLAEEVQPADADAGITGAAHAVAETGTLLLTYGEGRGREVGLLPDLHVAVLSADRIVGDLQTAVALAFAGGGAPPAAVTMITGLSASSDIEKLRITGVHGPRRLAVVVVG